MSHNEPFCYIFFQKKNTKKNMRSETYNKGGVSEFYFEYTDWREKEELKHLLGWAKFDIVGIQNFFLGGGMKIRWWDRGDAAAGEY